MTRRTCPRSHCGLGASGHQNSPIPPRLTVQANTLGAERGALLSELIRGWPTLEALVLADCTLADGSAAVAAALGGLVALREVDLRFNEFDDAAALVLAQSLRGKPQLESVLLDASDFGAEGLAAVRRALRKGVLRLSYT